ncbi:Ca2+:H+ antiporter [Fusarium coicis]|nr:Ca2+:H+ antiporter [Fusarium coicis]
MITERIGLKLTALITPMSTIACHSGISRGFVGLILIPIVGSAAEHVTDVAVTLRDKMDLAMGVAVGSPIQIALLVAPSLVIDGKSNYLEGAMLMALDIIVALAFYATPFDVMDPSK